MTTPPRARYLRVLFVLMKVRRRKAYPCHSCGKPLWKGQWAWRPALEHHHEHPTIRRDTRVCTPCIQLYGRVE